MNHENNGQFRTLDMGDVGAAIILSILWKLIVRVYFQGSLQNTCVVTPCIFIFLECGPMWLENTFLVSCFLDLNCQQSNFFSYILVDIFSTIYNEEYKLFFSLTRFVTNVAVPNTHYDTKTPKKNLVCKIQVFYRTEIMFWYKIITSQ